MKDTTENKFVLGFRLSFFGILVVLLSAITTVFSADEPSPIPKQFSVVIGGFFGASYELELHDGKLTYAVFESGRRNPKRSTLTPSIAQWREFRQSLDGLKIWQWRADYRNEHVYDGTQWSLDIACGDRAIKSRGNNSYPDANGRPNRNSEPTKTKTFDDFLHAVEKLIGRKTFR